MKVTIADILQYFKLLSDGSYDLKPDYTLYINHIRTNTIWINELGYQYRSSMNDNLQEDSQITVELYKKIKIF